MTNGCRPSRLRSIDEASCATQPSYLIEQRHDKARERILRVDFQHAFEEVADVARSAVPEQGYRRVVTEQRMVGIAAECLTQDHQRIVVAVGSVVHRGKLDRDLRIAGQAPRLLDLVDRLLDAMGFGGP